MHKDEKTDIAREAMESIEASPTQYHVVKRALELIDADILREDSPRWDICPGNTYAVVRNDASAVFFHVPADLRSWKARFEIAAAHTDSPCLKVKGFPIVDGSGYVRLNVEEYGGMAKKTWFDRPLSVAGRVCVRGEDGTIGTYLVDLARRVEGVIPTLAPHMGAKDTDEVSVQRQMMPIIGISSSDDANGQQAARAFDEAIFGYLIENYGVKVSRLLSSDLFVYVLDSARLLASPTAMGDSQIVVSPRLDDQACVWTAVSGFARMLDGELPSSDLIPVLALFDNEENGSMARHAADSSFLFDVLARAASSLGFGDADNLRSVLARSFMLSADNAHAKHPDHADKADPVNETLPGSGVVVKFSASQKYMSDARTAAALTALCEDNDIPVQPYYNNSDVRGGSTLGNISATHVSVPGADIGLAQLAMHSAYEMCSAEDMDSMERLFFAYFCGGRQIEATTADLEMY